MTGLNGERLSQMKYQALIKGKKAKFLILVGIAIISCIGIAIFARTHAVNKQSASGKVQTTVNVANVQRTDLLKRISLTGQTVPEAQVDIAAKYQGRVTAVNVSLGQVVSPGQVLISQDTGDAEIAIQQNQAAYQQAVEESVTSEASFNANFDKAKVDYQKAQASYERSRNLFDQGAISKSDLDVSEQQLAAAQSAYNALANQMQSGTAATVQSARAAALKAQHSVSAAEKQRSDLVLCAPRAGMIGYRQVEVGDIVSAGQKLLSIYDNSKLYVDCQVSEQDIGALSIGLGVDIQIDSLGKTVPGQIVYISPASDPQSLAFSIRVALLNPDPSVKAGMFTKGVINVPLRQNALVVPKDAVMEKNGSSYVFVVNEQNVVVQRTVQIGARGDQDVEILNGLNEGEKIAINNLARLRPQMVIVPNFVAPGDRGDNN